MAKVSRADIINANKSGLDNPDSLWSYHTPVLQVAYELGTRGIDLSTAPDVAGYRYGAVPTHGLSHNYRDDHSERGLSLVAINGQPAVASEIWFCDRKRVRVNGLLLPYKGSDGEPLILPYCVEYLD